MRIQQMFPGGTPASVPAILLAALLALCVACDDGGGDPPPVEMDMQVDMTEADSGPDPDMAPFARAEIAARPVALQLVGPLNEASTAEIVIRNEGDADLVIEQAEIMPADSPFTVSAPAMTVPPDGMTSLTVSFTPTDDQEQRAELIIRSNDREQGTLTIPVTGRAERNCYRVSPTQIEMGTVPLGMQSGRFGVSLSNCGDIPIDVTDVYIAGLMGFTHEDAMGGDGTGVLDAGAVRNISLWFQNNDIGPGERGMAQMVVLSDSTESPEVRIDLAVRGSGAPGCQPVFETDNLDFGQVRVGTEAIRPVTITNQGIDPCMVRDLAINNVAGRPENVFRLAEGLPGDVLGAGETATLQIGYAPVTADPSGERAELNFDYRDEIRMENRRATTLLTGVGSEAQVGGIPARVSLGLVTVPGCASWDRGTEGSNVGFVPICITGYELQGDDCGSFVLLEEPEFPEDGCIPLERNEGVPFNFVFQPDRLGEHECTLVVLSDAQNTQRLPIPVVGVGTDTAETTDTFTVGQLNPRAAAAFTLSRPVTPEGVVVLQNGAMAEGWRVSEAANAIIFPEGSHPPRDAELSVTYQAACLDRR